ncbi:hypothetical protein [Caballeronia sp. GAWG1-1]|uniref:hypothetical protein n=1 Tax=Caballeronia sp. GAWG1-1 TaxID=2921742 RepID=UPI002027E263|nr:hypothetical protein [Caballeronia sp. GAWG1-1]
MASTFQISSKRLLRAEQLLRDCGAKDIPPSTRVIAAFDAAVLCCRECAELTSSSEQEMAQPNPDVVLAVADLLAASAEQLGLPTAGGDLLLRLMQWSFFGLEIDMPCAPEDAVDLATELVERTRSLLLKSQDGAAIER